MIFFYFYFTLINISNFYILFARRRLHGWPNHVGGHYVCKIILIYFCAFVGNYIVYCNVILLHVGGHYVCKIILIYFCAFVGNYIVYCNVILPLFIKMGCFICSQVKTDINVIKEIQLSYGTNNVSNNKGLSCISILNTVIINPFPANVENMVSS